MKKQSFSLVLIAALMISCASTGDSSFSTAEENQASIGPASQGNEMGRANNNTPDLSSIEGSEWKLVEVYIDGRNTLFSRNTLPEDLKNFFTLNFNGVIISGVGAPNRYSAPYTITNNQISIMPMLSTMMASFFQPPNLTEHDFFNYMQNANRWNLADGNLELYSKGADGKETVLIFIR